MNCKEADILINKYLDGVITEEEAVLLNEHITQCPSCKEEFLLYDSIFEDIKEIPVMTAPEGFEKIVMAKVHQYNNMPILVRLLKEKVTLYIFAIFAVLFTTASILAFNRNTIISILSKNPSFEGMVRKMIPVAESFVNHTETLKEVFTTIISQVNGTLSELSGILAGAVILLCLLQGYILYRHRKIK